MRDESLSLEPRLVQWYFDNRIRTLTQFTLPQAAANDRLWFYLCQHNKPPSDNWMALNRDLAE